MADLIIRSTSIMAVLRLVFLTVVFSLFAVAPPALAGEVVRGNLFKAYLDESCTLELTYPSTRLGETEIVASVSLHADGGLLSCSRFRLQENWLYFTARGIDETAYKGTMTIEKTGVVKFELVRSDGRPVEWKMSFKADPGEHYYGFGEKAGWFDYRGKVSTVLNHDANLGTEDNYRGDNSYKSVPFFSSSRGYGVWLDDTVTARFDMDSAGTGEWSVGFNDDYLRLFFIAGPKLTDVLMRYTSLSGRPPLWPKWVFAPWKSRDVHQGTADVEEDIVRRRELDIPGSIIIIDSPWENAYNSFDFNTDQFEDPEGLLRKAHDYGYKVLVWITPMTNVSNHVDMPGINPLTTGNYNRIKKNGGFVLDEHGKPVIFRWWKGTGSLFDFTSPWLVEYFKKAVRHLAHLGVDGFKTDDGEGYYVHGVKFHDDTPARRMKNYYSYLYTKAAYEAWLEATGEPVVWARSGCAGTQQFSIQWPGDNNADWGANGLPSVVISAQSAAMSGYSVWGHDIAGYLGGDPTPELFARWTQLGALTPVMQIHMGSNQGVWSFGDAALDLARKYSKLHTSLFPYFYACAKEARDTGLPIIRPLPLLYQDDPEAHVQRYQYLLGNDILVAPVVQQGATEREVYFPPGSKWYEFWGDEYHEGGTIETVSAPVDVLPMYIREGSIVPMIPDDVDTLVDPGDVKVVDVVAVDERLIVRVWPAEEKSRFRMVDGSIFVSKRMEGKVALEVMANNRRLWLDVASIKPVEVSADGRDLEKKNCRQVISGEEGWCYSVILHNTIVYMETGDNPVVVTLNE